MRYLDRVRIGPDARKVLRQRYRDAMLRIMAKEGARLEPEITMYEAEGWLFAVGKFRRTRTAFVPTGEERFILDALGRE